MAGGKIMLVSGSSMKKSKGRKRTQRLRLNRPLGVKNPSAHRFQASYYVDVGVVPSSNIATGSFAFHSNNNSTAAANGYFSFANIPGYAEFAALFDQYKITTVKATFSFNKNSAETGSDGICIPCLHWAVDHDDGTPWSTTAQMLQYGTYRSRIMTRPITINIHPKTTKLIYRTGVSDAYAVDDKAEWIDMAYTDVPFYGFKWAYDTFGSNEDELIGTIRILFKFTFETRNRM